MLFTQQNGKKSGSFDEKEVSVIIKLVLHHNVEADEVQRNLQLQESRLDLKAWT